jgi:leucyl-tRNA synthetase
MTELMKDAEMRKSTKLVARFVSQIVDEINRTGRGRRQKLLSLEALNERAVLSDAAQFLTRELNAEIQVYVEDDRERYDPKNRAQLAKPFRPAIYLE